MGRHKKKRKYPPSVTRYRQTNPQITFHVKKEIKEEIEGIMGKDAGMSVNQWCKQRILQVLGKTDERETILEEITEYVKAKESYKYENEALIEHLKKQGISVANNVVKILASKVRKVIEENEQGTWNNTWKFVDGRMSDVFEFIPKNMRGGDKGPIPKKSTKELMKEFFERQGEKEKVHG